MFFEDFNLLLAVLPGSEPRLAAEEVGEIIFIIEVQQTRDFADGQFFVAEEQFRAGEEDVREIFFQRDSDVARKIAREAVARDSGDLRKVVDGEPGADVMRDVFKQIAVFFKTVLLEKFFVGGKQFRHFQEEESFDAECGGEVGTALENGGDLFHEFRIVPFPQDGFGKENILIRAVQNIEMKSEKLRAFPEFKQERKRAAGKIEAAGLHFDLPSRFGIADERGFPGHFLNGENAVVGIAVVSGTVEIRKRTLMQFQIELIRIAHCGTAVGDAG